MRLKTCTMAAAQAAYDAQQPPEYYMDDLEGHPKTCRCWTCEKERMDYDENAG